MTASSEHPMIATHPRQLIQQVRRQLNGEAFSGNWDDLSVQSNIKRSAVLLLLTMHQRHAGAPFEPCLLLNKRSEKVLQPGDLCCPGGGVGRLDRWAAPFMQGPLTPLTRWPGWQRWRSGNTGRARGLALLLATGLREAWEEMRLNPFRVTFLGPLPVQKLIMFDRLIYPLAGWVPSNLRLKPNWEVARIVYIPLARLLEPTHYARLRLSAMARNHLTPRKEDFPCFIHQDRNGEEIFWGATFRIAIDFLNQVFGFELPDLKETPIRNKRLGPAYLNGSLMDPKNINLNTSDEDD
jgi:8-oxo-dGTP pyrophosphatase MutT (NUDIX family)